MTEQLLRLWREEEAADSVEYGLIVALVAVALIGTLVLFRDSIKKLFTDSATEIANPPQ